MNIILSIASLICLIFVYTLVYTGGFIELRDKLSSIKRNIFYAYPNLRSVIFFIKNFAVFFFGWSFLYLLFKCYGAFLANDSSRLYQLFTPTSFGVIITLSALLGFVGYSEDEKKFIKNIEDDLEDDLYLGVITEEEFKKYHLKYAPKKTYIEKRERILQKQREKNERIRIEKIIAEKAEQEKREAEVKKFIEEYYKKQKLPQKERGQEI